MNGELYKKDIPIPVDVVRDAYRLLREEYCGCPSDTDGVITYELLGRALDQNNVVRPDTDI